MPYLNKTFGYTVEASARGTASSSYYEKCWAEPTTAALRKYIQQGLANELLYNGLIDGAWGPKTIKAIQGYSKLRDAYNGPVDGAVGGNTVIGIIVLAHQFALSSKGLPSDARAISQGSGIEPYWAAMYLQSNIVWNNIRKRLLIEFGSRNMGSL